MHPQIPILFLMLACGSPGELDKPNPAPTWYIEDTEEKVQEASVADPLPETEPTDEATEPNTSEDKKDATTASPPTKSKSDDAGEAQ